MLTSDGLKAALDELELENRPAIAHASLSSFGEVEGGADTVLGVLLDSLSGLMMPTFTYKTMILPEVGPPNNGITYGSQFDLNRMAQPFRRTTPADPIMGRIPERLRQYSAAVRTFHPILSFAGIGVDDALQTQTINNPFAPVSTLARQDGWVLLLGVDHTSNTSIHYAERLAGRHQFVRWALTTKRAVECRGFPGCSDGFEDIRPEIDHLSKRVEVGEGFIEAMPLRYLLEFVEEYIKKNPLALLCHRKRCQRCDTVRMLAG
jgi:aminoglycoside 3-N-acetyltransferase